MMVAVPRADIDDRVRKIIAEQFLVDPSEVRDDSTLDSLGADSLDRLELVMALEEEFEIEIPDEVGEKLRTVRAAIDYVVRRLR